MDTIRDRQELESMYERGQAPWAVWNRSEAQPRFVDLTASERIMT
jgi:hypothetical protein